MLFLLLALQKYFKAVNWKVSGWSTMNAECKKTEVHENLSGKTG
jgi:hypothetical protein